MKPSGQGRQFNTGESTPSLSRYVSGTHVTSAPGGGMSHPIYLTQSLPGLHPSFSSLSSQGSGSSSHGSRDYHPQHLHGMEVSGGLPHRGQMVSGLGMLGHHPPMHMTQHRRLSGHRVSLLRDIGIAGERERAESSGSSMMPHSFSTGAQSHLMNNTLVYTTRPNISVLTSISNVQNPQGMLVGSLASQVQSGTPPRHTVGSSQMPRHTSGSLHQYPVGSSLYLSSASSIKSEPGVYGGYVKEEPGQSKSPMDVSSVPPQYPQMSQHHQFQSHPSQQQGSVQAPSAKVDLRQEKGKEGKPAKEHLLQAMDKVDKEITKVQSEMTRLERKKKELENAAKKPQQVEKPVSPKKVEPKHRDLWQVIYAENKKKAEAAQGLLEHLGQRFPMPLYNQPRDTQVYKDNLKKNEEMRPKLLAYFQKKSQLSNIRDRYLCARYNQMMTDWQKRADKVENNKTRKAKEAKVREFFEKQFPEIRKQREQQERFSRSGTRGDACRSEADFNEIVDGLSEQEHHEQHMRQLAVVPPMLLDRDERRLKFLNNNGLVTAPLEDYKKRQELDNWSPQEKQIFKEKYIQNPKNFQAISSCLGKKSVADCVLFYYLSKKSVGYKGLVRKNTLKPRKPKSGRAQQATSGHDIGKSSQQTDKLLDKDDLKKSCLDVLVKEEEVERIERPPSPRMTRSRNKNLNWTDDDITVAKEGFGKHGKDFAAISRLFANKTESQVKNFYIHYKKKHNLDQLISDGKKKKLNEGSRRTRTQTQTSESTAAAVEEIPAGDEEHPTTADPQIPAEGPDASKKRKKDSDADKKEEPAKLEDAKNAATTSESPSSVGSTDGESGPASRGATPVAGLSVSHIRTRRAAAAAGTGSEARSESAKRSSESSPVHEPAEKKAKKLKSLKDAKTENKDTCVGAFIEKKRTETIIPSTEKEKLEEKDENNPPNVITPKEEPVTGLAVAMIPPSEQPLSEAGPVFTPVISVGPVQAPTSAFVSAVKTPDSALVLTYMQPAATRPVMTATMRSSILSGMAKADDELALKTKHENDGDSSATCSADEEPNMQDVKTGEQGESKHADSPYAFEDDSSESIKLETPRTHTAAIVAASVQLPMQTSKLESSGRPASTHAPPQTKQRAQDEKRPQSLPPPPGALPATSLPIGAIRPPMRSQADDGRPNSTPVFIPGIFPPQGTLVSGSIHIQARGVDNVIHSEFEESKHIVGKVPEEAEFLCALQTMMPTSSGLRHVMQSNVPHPASVQSVATPTQTLLKQADASKNPHTIDLTMPTMSNQRVDNDPGKKPPMATATGPRLPHYHPVSPRASSLQKDFGPRRMEMKLGEGTVSCAHKYTTTDLAAMRDRAAVLPTGPIPVSSLRFPMHSSFPAVDPGKTLPEVFVKKEATSSAPDRMADSHNRGEPSSSMVQRMGQHVVPPQISAGFVRPSLITSPIQTKFVSRTMTSGVSVLQKRSQKPLMESLPISYEGTKIEVKPPISHPVPYSKTSGPVLNRPSAGHAEDRMRLIGNTVKVIPASRASIVKGTPIPHEGPSGAARAPLVLDGSRTNSPSPDVKACPGPTPQVLKPLAGSITTGLPVHRIHEARPEHLVRTDIISGREIVVQAPLRASPSPNGRQAAEDARRHDQKMFHEARTAMHPHLAYPSRFPIHSNAAHALPVNPELHRGSPTPGSILAGTPVKRNTSDEPNSNMSPSSNPGAFPGVVVSRHSPTPVQSSVKQPDRKGPRGNQPSSEMFWSHSQPYHKYLPGGDKTQKDDRYLGARRTPDRVGREPPPSALSPGQRRTPTGLLAQHPMVKQEVPGSPRSGDEPTQRPPGALPHMLDPRMLAAATNNQDLMRMSLAMHPNYAALGSLGAPAGLVNPEIMEILRQYGGPGPPAAYPIYFHGLPGYPGLPNVMAPIGSPIAPGSPQTDDSREMTKKLLSQDFLTAQQMQRNLPGVTTTTTVTVPGTGPLGFPLASHSMTTGITPGHLVASPSTPYLGAYPQGPLPVDRLNFIPQPPDIRSPFSPYLTSSGRGSSARSPIPISPGDSSRSPIQRHIKAPSPDFAKQRHRSGEQSRDREVPIHYVGKGRSSPASPYHSPRGTTSPRERYTPQGLAHHRQSSPSHGSQRGPNPAVQKQFYHQPPSSTPAQIAFHPVASPHHLPPGYILPYNTGMSDALNALVETASKQPRAPDSRSSPFRHTRTGSLDAGTQLRPEKLRPDSAGPLPRPHPQTHVPVSHELHKQLPYHHGVKHEACHSPKPQTDRNQQCPAPGMIVRDSREAQKLNQDQQYFAQMGQRGSPRTTPKPTSTGNAVRSQPVGRSPQPMSGMPQVQQRLLQSQRQQTTSPNAPQHGMPSGVYGKASVRPQPQPGPDDAMTSKEVSEKQPPKSMSSNPGEDLKKSGRAKMTAANLIDAIININYAELERPPQRSPTNVKSPRPLVNQHPQPHQSRQSSVPPPHITERQPVHSQSMPIKQEMQLQKPGRYEGESKPGVSSATAPAFAQMLSFLQSSGLPPDIGKQDSAKSAHSSPTNRTLSFAEHSADVIHECYRKTTSENSTSPVSVGSPNTPCSGSNVGMEPISPPEGRSEASNAPVKKPQQSTTVPPHPQQQHFHPQMQQPQLQRFPTQPLQTQSERNMLSSSPRPPAQIQVPRPLIPPQTLPAQSMGIPLSQLNPGAPPPPHINPAAAGGNTSLEDIIRKALMNGSPSTSPELRRPAEQMMAGLQPGPDLFITHAAMMSTMPRSVATMPPVAQTVPQKPALAESRIESVPASQGEQRGGSGKYMSALMFRQMPLTASPQGANQVASQAQERPQQMYPGPAPRSTHTSSSGSAHSPATLSDPGQQRPAMLPQYEALSDSD